MQIVALVIRNTGYPLHTSKFYGYEFPSATHQRTEAENPLITSLVCFNNADKLGQISAPPCSHKQCQY